MKKLAKKRLKHYRNYARLEMEFRQYLNSSNQQVPKEVQKRMQELKTQISFSKFLVEKLKERNSTFQDRIIEQDQAELDGLKKLYGLA